MSKSFALFTKWLIVFAALAVPAAGVANGTNHWLQTDRTTVSIGGFLVTYDSSAQVSSSTLGIGTDIDLEDDLGVDDEHALFRLDAQHRFSARHRIEFSYFDASRDGKTQLARDVQFDEQIFAAGSVVATDLDLQVYRLSYLYSIYQTPRTDLALAAGVYAFDTGFFMKSNIGVQESEDATAGFPAFGLKVMHAFDPTYTLMAGVQYFAVNEDDVEGDLLDVVIAAEGAFWKKLAAGFGYNVVEIFGEDTEDKDKVEYDFSGFLLYLKYRF